MFNGYLYYFILLWYKYQTTRTFVKITIDRSSKIGQSSTTLTLWNLYCKIRFPNDFLISRRLLNNNQIVNSLTRNCNIYHSYHLLKYGTYYLKTFWNKIKNNSSLHFITKIVVKRSSSVLQTVRLQNEARGTLTCSILAYIVTTFKIFWFYINIVFHAASNNMKFILIL